MTLADLILDQVVFFANSSEHDVQRDVAVQQLESIVSELSDLAPSDARAFRDALESRIGMARTPDERQALLDLRESIV